MLTGSSIAKGRQKLSHIEKELGSIPNLLTEMSPNPATVLVYMQGRDALAAGTLTPREQQAVQLRISVVNGCHYCQAAHKWLGRKSGLSPEDLSAILGRRVPQDKRLAAVVRATDLLLEKKGWLDAEDLLVLDKQGVDRIKLYEIIAFIGLTTISNYINHIAHTPTDRLSGGMSWNAHDVAV